MGGLALGVLVTTAWYTELLLLPTLAHTYTRTDTSQSHTYTHRYPILTCTHLHTHSRITHNHTYIHNANTHGYPMYRLTHSRIPHNHMHTHTLTDTPHTQAHTRTHTFTDTRTHTPTLHCQRVTKWFRGCLLFLAFRLPRCATDLSTLAPPPGPFWKPPPAYDPGSLQGSLSLAMS